MTAKEKNAHYGRLNARFDRRAHQLVKLGFKHIEGIFTKVMIPGMKPTNILGSFVMHADKIVWADKISDIS